MNDPRVGQDLAYQADAQEVSRQLVDDPDSAIRQRRQPGKIGLAKPPQGSAVKSGNVFRKLIAVGHLLEGRQFAGRMNLRMAGKYLLDQSAARARHANDENRN